MNVSPQLLPLLFVTALTGCAGSGQPAEPTQGTGSVPTGASRETGDVGETGETATGLDAPQPGGGTETAAGAAAATGDPTPLGPAPWPADEGFGTASNDGRYWVVYVPSVDEIPLNEEFDIELRVFDGETRSQLVDAEVAVDARMPAHGHGMKIDPVPQTREDGSFEVLGMLLHMVGHWELYVDLTVGPYTERAQFDIELE